MMEPCDRVVIVSILSTLCFSNRDDSLVQFLSKLLKEILLAFIITTSADKKGCQETGNNRDNDSNGNDHAQIGSLCTVWLYCQTITPGPNELCSLLIPRPRSDGDIVGWDLRRIAAGGHEVEGFVQLTQHQTVLSKIPCHLRYIVDT